MAGVRNVFARTIEANILPQKVKQMIFGNAENARKSTHQNKGLSLSSALEIARIRIGKRKKRKNELLPSLHGLV